MGLYTFSLAGGGLMLIGAWEAFISSYTHLHPPSPPLSHPHQTLKNPQPNPLISSINFISISLLSLFFILDSLISLNDALQSKDRVGFALQLEIISISSLFCLYALVSLSTNFIKSIQFPSSVPNLIALFAFGQEFLHFYLQRKYPTGLENRYFDLLLVPIGICILSTVFELGSSKFNNLFSLARGVGLVLQGTWFIQMGLSFFTNLMANGCNLVQKSRGNFTVMCKGHMDSHRSKGIATLQFNCHLSLLVVLCMGVYSIIAWKYGIERDYLNYKPLNAELHNLDRQNQFTLESDDDEVAMDTNLAKLNDVGIGSKSGVNGLGAH